MADSVLPASGQRITPTVAGRLATIATPNQAPALKTSNPTYGWRLLELAITVLPSFTAINYGMVWLGDGGWVDGGEIQTTRDKVPGEIVLDGVYLHGQPSTSSMRCLSLTRRERPSSTRGSRTAM